MRRSQRMNGQRRRISEVLDERMNGRSISEVLDERMNGQRRSISEVLNEVNEETSSNMIRSLEIGY
jgi:flagellar motor switch protein FliG